MRRAHCSNKGLVSQEWGSAQYKLPMSALLPNKVCTTVQTIIKPTILLKLTVI